MLKTILFSGDTHNAPEDQEMSWRQKKGTSVNVKKRWQEAVRIENKTLHTIVLLYWENEG